jgi:hypothetical protein
MSDLASFGIMPLPPWSMAAALLALFLLVSFVSVRRSGSYASVAALFGIPALMIIAWSAWNFADHAVRGQRMAERESLDARRLQLSAVAMMPGSPLACLEGGVGEAVDSACEAIIFRAPETVAAAASYVEAELRLLGDGFEYAHRADNLYYNTLAQLRSGLEADRYGFVAHVLMTRDGCTADSCVVLSWLLRDSAVVKANMAARRLENNVARYATTWNGQKGFPAAAAIVPPPAAAPLAATVSSVPATRPIDFPSAASIPPVNIMTDAPMAAVEAPPAPPAAAPPARRPAASAAPARAPANPPAAPNPAARPQ